MRKLFIILIIALTLSSVESYAGLYGIIKGKVLDEEGNGAIGATVRVEGTTRGTYVKNPNGEFTITNVRAGEYDVRISMTGRTPIVKKVKVSADITVDIGTFELQVESAMMDEIVVDADAIMVDKNQIGDVQKFNSDQLEKTAREGVNSVIGLSAGVQSSGGGFNIRGSRTQDTQIMVEGVMVTNQFTGGLGPGGTGYFPMVSAFGTEEVQVLTGGFSAEYGQATGGVVNSVVRSGRTDRYDGFLRWRTDVPALFGSQSSDIDVVRVDNQLTLEEEGEGYQWQGQNQHKFDFGAGGPIPLLNRSTFYLTGVYQYEEFLGNNYNVTDPLGNNLGQLPDNGAWVKNITGRFTFDLTNAIDLTAGGSFGMSNFENSGWTWLYADREGTNADGVTFLERQAKQNVINQLVSTAYIRLNHTLSANSFYEVEINNSIQSDQGGRRANLDGPSYFGGFDIIEPQDEFQADADGNLVPGSDKILDHYTYLVRPGSFTQDGYFQTVIPQVNPLTGFIEGGQFSQGTNNAYGLRGSFQDGGNTGGTEFRTSNIWEVKGSYTQVFKTGEFNHTLKAGTQMQFFTLHRFQNSLPWSGNPFFDVYTDRYGGNIWADDQELIDETSEPFNPILLGFYAQDQVTYKGIIFSAGLRFDYFDPNSEYRTLENNQFVSVGADSGFAQADAKMQLSPRINITYPITDRSNISIAYGLYFKIPTLQYLYDSYNLIQLRGNQLLGNPNLDPERTNSYQVNYNNQITDDFAFSVSAYYKDMFNQVGLVYVPQVPTAFYQYAVAEYGNSRGLEFTLRKRRTDNFAFDINYTLQSVVGTAPFPEANANQLIDPYTQQFTIPLAPYAQGWDIRHTINGTMNFFFNNDEGPSIGGIQLLENTDLALTGRWRTGAPFTRFDQDGNQISELNGARLPNFWSLDLRFSKVIPMRDLFGDGAGNSSVELFVDVFNLVNRFQATSLYSRSGDPDDNGVSLYIPEGNYPNVNYYKEADYSNAFSFSAEQYDIFGYRFYNENSDYDDNGVVTRSEQYQSYINFLENSIERRPNYQVPRRVYMGLMFRF